MGFYQSGGQGFIWVTLPFVDTVEQKNQPQWWGDVGATVAYCKVNLPRICARYGGDPSAVFLTGFSRGAIAGGYIGLHDDEIAGLWLGFMPHSHHDGGSYTPDGARERVARIKGRASLLTWGEHDNGKENSLVGKAMLENLGFPLTGIEIPGIAHTDRWIEVDSPQRRQVRGWLASTLRDRPGTKRRDICPALPVRKNGRRSAGKCSL